MHLTVYSEDFFFKEVMFIKYEMLYKVSEETGKSRS